MTKNWIQKMDHIKYTWEHKKAFLKVEKEFLGKNTIRGYLHDMDKIFMYCLPIITTKKVNKIHRKFSGHHFPNFIISSELKMQAIIDWECARLTKKDKPLDAVDTLFKYYPEAAKYMYLEFEKTPLYNKYVNTYINKGMI